MTIYAQHPTYETDTWLFALCSWLLNLRAKSQQPKAQTRSFGCYSHSIVAGGLDEISYTTRLTPLTSLMMRLETLPRSSGASLPQSAFIPSEEVTQRNATTCS